MSEKKYIDGNLVITFGPYIGKKLKDVPAQYLIDLDNKGIIRYGSVKAYVKENRKALKEKKAKEKKKPKN